MFLHGNLLSGISLTVVLTSRAEVMRIHKCDRKGILCMQGALVSVTSVHCIHHVCHFLSGGPHGILALLCEFAAQPKEKTPTTLMFDEH